MDDLHLITAEGFDEASHLASLRRVLRALCVRTPGVYCQAAAPDSNRSGARAE